VIRRRANAADPLTALYTPHLSVHAEEDNKYNAGCQYDETGSLDERIDEHAPAMLFEGVSAWRTRIVCSKRRFRELTAAGRAISRAFN